MEEYQKECFHLIASELNVKNVLIGTKGSTDEMIKVEYDTALTDALKLEGEMRELIRSIQQERKNKGVKIDEKITVTIPHKFAEFAEQIQKKVLAKSVSLGDTPSQSFINDNS